MDLETFEEIVRLFALTSFAFRSLGLIVLGLGIGWLSLQGFRKSGGSWYIKVASLFSFVALAAVVVRFQSAGAVGAFGLGAGLGVLFWGLRGKEDEEEDEE
jgi:hypothetical protein